MSKVECRFTTIGPDEKLMVVASWSEYLVIRRGQAIVSSPSPEAAWAVKKFLDRNELWGSECEVMEDRTYSYREPMEYELAAYAAQCRRERQAAEEWAAGEPKGAEAAMWEPDQPRHLRISQ